MKKIFSAIFKQSVATVLITLLVLGFGVFAALNMNINLLPDINVPIVCAQVVYKGANAASVEKDVTSKLETGLGSISGVTETKSYSYDNLSAVILSFEYGTDTDEKKADIQSKLNALDLPDGVTKSVYNLDLNGSALATLSVTDEGGAEAALKKAESLSAKIAAIDGVESVSVKGGATYAYVVRPFGGLELITPLLVESFSVGELNIPIGNIVSADGAVQIRNNTEIKSVEDILSSPVVLTGNALTTLKLIKQQILAYQAVGVIGEYPFGPDDLNTIKRNTEIAFTNEALNFILTTDFNYISLSPDGEEKKIINAGAIASVKKEASYSAYAYISEGEAKLAEGIIVEVYKANGANSAKVVKEVKKVYSDDDGQNINLLDDQSEFISDSISNVLVSMVIGGVLAVIIIFLFLKRVGTSLIIAVTMPLSVLAAIICMFLAGITLNMVSLGGLAVGIGMLVDNSIVVIEAISKHREKGKTAHESAVDGATEVGGALFGSTLTTVCVFIPILFSGGLTAEIFCDLSLAVIFSLVFSLIVALTVIPTLYVTFCSDRRLKRRAEGLPEPKEDQAEGEEKPDTKSDTKADIKAEPANLGKKIFKPVIMNGISRAYEKILPKVLGKKLLTILLAVAVFGASVGLLFLTGTEFLPAIDKGQIEVKMSYGSGKSLEAVQKDVLEFADEIVNGVEDISYVSASVGKNGLLALTDTGIITVQLNKNKNTEKTVDKIRDLAKTKQTVGKVAVKQIDGVVASLTSGASDMTVSVVGSDGEKLKEISDKIKTKLDEEGFSDIGDTLNEKGTQYLFDFDRTKIASAGIDYKNLVMTLRIGLASYTACTVTIDGENSSDLKVCFSSAAITSKADLENFIVGVSSSGKIALKNLLKNGEVIEAQTETCISKLNGNKVISISAALSGVDTGTATRKMEKVTSDVLAEYEGYSFVNSGISSYLDDAFKGLYISLAISFFLLYAVMAIQFSSFVKPLIVMASIPFCFTGGFIALVITRTSLNVVSFIGLIMLMGVIVNNAIVMLEKIKQLIAEGIDRYQAVVNACNVRLRPILMTTVTTILALIPLAIGVGKGSELMQPLGIVVIGGLLLGTLVTLVLVPAVYCAVYKIKPPEKETEKEIKNED